MPTLIVFCHLRWDFVFQRPQHLLTRAARERRVFYVQEPEWGGETVRYAIAVLYNNKVSYINTDSLGFLLYFGFVPLLFLYIVFCKLEAAFIRFLIGCCVTISSRGRCGPDWSSAFTGGNSMKPSTVKTTARSPRSTALRTRS